jgi:DNA-binding GntR family transcriptional regulator
VLQEDRQVNKQGQQNSAVSHEKTVGPQVYQLVRARIIQGDIAPGTRLSEAEISKAMNVSRQPVREAFIKLRDEGLVEVRPQRGTFVTKILIGAVSDARFMREAIEADIVKLLAEDASLGLVPELRVQIQLQRKLGQAELTKFMELDDQFHRSLAEFAGKANAWKVIAGMKAHFDRVRYLGRVPKNLQRLVDQHEAVVDAIEKRDRVAAEAAMRFHLQEVLRDLPKVVAEDPEKFAYPALSRNVDPEAL